MSKQRKHKKSFKEIQASVASEIINSNAPEVSISTKPETSQLFEWAFDKKYSFVKKKAFGWANENLPTLLFKVIKKLNVYSKMTWGQLLSNAKKHHFHSVDESRLDTQILNFLKINKATDGDLCQLGIDDKHRVVGIKKGNIFYLVCNDPNHDIYD